MEDVFNLPIIGVLTMSSITTEGSQNHETREFLSFKLGNEHFAIDIGYVQEVCVYNKPTPTPQKSQYMQGAMNLRGECIPVIDLHTYIFEQGAETLNFLIVAEVQGVIMALGVVAPVLVIQVEHALIRPNVIRTGGKRKLSLFGIVNNENKMTVLLDLEVLAKELELL